jgi:integrase
MENLVTLIGSKAIVSNLDKRLATVISIEDDKVKLDMERIGIRVLPLSVVENGFTALLDNKTLIETFVLREIQIGTKMDEKAIFGTAIRVGEILRKRFKDIDDKECFLTLKGLYL